MTEKEVTDVDKERLVHTATAIRQNAYAVYSGYKVGAAVLDELGRVHTGCNVENSSSPLGTCAEANAIGAMIAAGGKRIVAIAALGGRDELEDCTPCGGCRQIIQEFSDGNTQVFLIGEHGEIETHTIDTLLPLSFRLR